jgi:opacity protein-like surface antigen
MKRYSKIAFALLLLAHLNPVLASDYSGYTLRASFGYINAGFKNSAELRVPAQGNTSNYGGNYSIRGNANNVSYGLGVGYWFNNIKSMPYAIEFLGLVENAGFSRNSWSMLNTVAPKLNDNISGKLRGSVALYFKPGYKVSQNFLTYLFIGPKLGRFVVNSTSSFEFIGGGAQHYYGAFTSSTTSTKLGYGVGIGGQYNLFKNLMLGIEYTFSSYNNVKTPYYASTRIYDINTNALFGDLNKSYGPMDVQTNNISVNVIYRI